MEMTIAAMVVVSIIVIVMTVVVQADIPLPQGFFHLLRFRRKCENRVFKCPAFSVVTELRGLE